MENREPTGGVNLGGTGRGVEEWAEEKHRLRYRASLSRWPLKSSSLSPAWDSLTYTPKLGSGGGVGSWAICPPPPVGHTEGISQDLNSLSALEHRKKAPGEELLVPGVRAGEGT